MVLQFLVGSALDLHTARPAWPESRKVVSEVVDANLLE